MEHEQGVLVPPSAAEIRRSKTRWRPRFGSSESRLGDEGDRGGERKKVHWTALPPFEAYENIQPLNVTPANAPQLSRTLIAALLLLAAAHLALGRAHAHRLGSDEDRLLLYFTGAALGRGATADALQRRAAASMRANGVPEEQPIRIDMHADRIRAYAGASVVYRVSAAVVARWMVAGAGDYPSYLAPALFAGQIAAYTIIAGLVLLVAWRCGQRMTVAISASLALSGALMALARIVGGGLAAPHRLLPMAGDYDYLAAAFWFGVNSIGMIVHPRFNMSVFADTPRNHILLAMIIVFALRWTSRHRAAAYAMLALSLLHQSMAGLLCLGLIACDLVVRPRVFEHGGIRTPYFATLALTVGLEVIRPYQSPAILASLFVTLGIVFAGMILAPRYRPAWLDRIAKSAGASSEMWSDLRFLFVLWAVTVPLVTVFNAFADPIASRYFWSELHGRLLAALRPVLLLASCLTLGDRIAVMARPAKAWMVAGACAAGLLPGLVLAARYNRTPVESLRDALRVIDVNVGPRIDWTRIGQHSERQVYYLLSRAIEEREPVQSVERQSASVPGDR